MEQNNISTENTGAENAGTENTGHFGLHRRKMPRRGKAPGSGRTIIKA